MTEESMLSTAESGYGPTYGYDQGQGAGAVQAEMITKKLANYWCLIGSIPLVLFLLVAIPTIFFVKRFSDYVNAYYCDTKSCKEIADAILASGSISDSCGNFSKAACSSKKPNYIVQLWTKMEKELKDGGALPSGESGPPENLLLSFKYKALAELCKVYAPQPEVAYAVDLLKLIGKKLGIGENVDATNQLNIWELSGTMAALGLDGMVRAVAILDNDTHKALELSAPIKDMYPTMLMDILGKSYKDLMAGIDLEDPFLPNSPEDFAKQFADFLLDKTSKAEDNIPIVMTMDELIAKDQENPNAPWKWDGFFNSFKAVAKSVSNDYKIRLSHPTYLLGLYGFSNITVLLPGAGNVVLQLNALIHLLGPLAFLPKDRKDNPHLCYPWADRVLPGASAAAFFLHRIGHFGAINGIQPNMRNATAMVDLLNLEVQGVLDSMALSFSLSVSAPEPARAGFYQLTKKMSKTPGAFYNNGTKDVDHEMLKRIIMFDVPDEGDPITFAADAKLHLMSKYWDYTPELLKFREPFGSTQIYASYSPTEQHLFVPMGVFTKPFFRNTKHNRAFTALSGYAVIAGLMHALTAYGASVAKNEIYPVPWAGYSWMDKMVKFQNCMRVQRKQNGSLLGAMDQYMLGAVSPTYRYYRRSVLRVAYPRPEFRIDWIGDYSSTHIFFYTWAMMHCGSPNGRKLIDLTAKNSKYFHEGFSCESKLNPHRCQLWESSRRNY